jgi:hypothetical protein
MNKVVRKPGSSISRLCRAWWGPPGVHARLRRLDLLPIPERLEPGEKVRREKLRASALAKMVACKRCACKRALPPHPYCLSCDRHLRTEMRRTGYLQPYEPTRRRRREMMENTLETKRGMDR